MCRTWSGSIAFAATLVALLGPVPGAAQSQLPRPSQLPPPGGNQPAPQRPQAPSQNQPSQARPQASAPAKPYKPVAVRPPAPLNDPSLEAFRKQLAGIVERKDRSTLARLVAQGFFWLRESGDAADKSKSGIDNLARAIGLDGKDAPGWDMLDAYAADPTGAPLPDRKGVICSPADPSFDENAFEQLVDATQTDIAEWGYPVSSGVEVRAAPRANAQAIDKLGMNFIRVVPEDVPNADEQQPFLKVVTPAGKTGFVLVESIVPLGGDQLCYIRDAGGWKIAGYIGGEPAQP